MTLSLQKEAKVEHDLSFHKPLNINLLHTS